MPPRNMTIYLRLGEAPAEAVRRTFGAEDAWVNGVYVGWRKGEIVKTARTPEPLRNWWYAPSAGEPPVAFDLLLLD